ncbi:MAG TPA: methylated-DNA--[protein]-cysteine S-methyltransferase [Usitatibacter sp.]|nr:methylated-DNA--[protein]-cysteine S-methyltransferase [Usitatibacter sp.]
MIAWTRFETPLGTMLAIAEDDALASLDFTDAKYARAIEPAWRESPRSPLLLECARQVREYLEGRRRAFELPLAPRGTAFQRRVWMEIARIPYGGTITYGELARSSGAPGSARAAGAATGRNPIAIVVPCHRVLGSDGALTGYAGGVDRKAKLLALEGAIEEALA